MIGSTRFYESQGDPAAFSEVRRHFTEVYEEVRSRRGAVVKTIGDAVMAAFHDPIDALEAARRILARFPAGRPDTSIRLRISLNTGPCIAVNLNSAIDYFGRTVNLASKLQALAEAGQVAFPRRLRQLPGVTAYLESQHATLDELELRHEAIHGPVPAYRWTV
jgi:class 3 adenylate cyclase